MRIIKLLLLLTFGLLADFKLDIPNDINVSQLENIVENGWDESNETLNNFIVLNAERVMPEILEKIKKPVLEVRPRKNMIDPMPKLLLSKDDYYLLFSYVKYLEYAGKTDRSLKIYVGALQGLANIKDKTMLSMIYRMTIETIIIKNFDKKYFTSKQIKYLKSKIDMVLIQNTQILWDAIERDRRAIVEELKNELLFKTKILNSVNNSLNEKIIDRFDKMKYQYNKFFYALDTKEKLIEFENNFKKKRDEVMSKYIEWEKNRKSNSSEETVVSLVSNYLFVIGNPKLVNIKLDLWESIKQNKAFLKQLK